MVDEKLGGVAGAANVNSWFPADNIGSLRVKILTVAPPFRFTDGILPLKAPNLDEIQAIPSSVPDTSTDKSTTESENPDEAGSIFPVMSIS